MVKNTEYTSEEVKIMNSAIITSSGADALVWGGVYSTKTELLDDALRTFFEFRKDMRITAVVEMYKTDEISISKAAELAGVSTEEIKDFLAKAGIKIRRGFSRNKGSELAELVR
jgi:predicted HTH domain antitoxin